LNEHLIFKFHEESLESELFNTEANCIVRVTVPVYLHIFTYLCPVTIIHLQMLIWGNFQYLWDVQKYQLVAQIWNTCFRHNWKARKGAHTWKIKDVF
jgi:hypothetical protein